MSYESALESQKIFSKKFFQKKHFYERGARVPPWGLGV
jgi:hypothetical protein